MDFASDLGMQESFGSVLSTTMAQRDLSRLRGVSRLRGAQQDLELTGKFVARAGKRHHMSPKGRHSELVGRYRSAVRSRSRVEREFKMYKPEYNVCCSNREYFVKELEWEVEKLKGEIEQNKDLQKEREKERQQYEEEKREFDTEISQLRCDLEQEKQTHSGNLAILQNLQQEYEKLRIEKERLQTWFIEECKSKDDANLKLRDEMVRLKSNYKSSLAEQTKNCEFWKAAKKEAQYNMMKVQTRYAEIEKKYANSLAENTKYREELADIRKKHQLLKSHLADSQNKCNQLQQEISLLSIHVCPQIYSQLQICRNTDEILISLWSYLLREKPSGLGQRYKSQISDFITEQPSQKCSHRSIILGLQRLNFNISHSEALGLISAISPTTDPENSKVPSSHFLKLIERKQPYLIWEDISETVEIYRVIFSCNGSDLPAVKSSICRHDRSMTKSDIAQKLKGKSFNVQDRLSQDSFEHAASVKKRAEDFADFLLLGSDSLQASIIIKRFAEVVPIWKPFSELKNQCQEEMIKILIEDKRFKRYLETNTQSIVTIEEFKEMCLKHCYSLTDDMLLYVSCLNFQRGIFGKVSIGVTLDFIYSRFMEEMNMPPQQPETVLESDDEVKTDNRDSHRR